MDTAKNTTHRKRRNINANIPEQFILLNEIMQLTGKSRATIYRWCKNKTFPEPYKIGDGSIGWKRSEYIKWQNQLQKVRY